MDQMKATLLKKTINSLKEKFRGETVNFQMKNIFFFCDATNNIILM